MATNKILYATDYSEPCQVALDFATSLARDRGATLLITHVSDLELFPVGEAFDEEPKPSPQELAKLHEVVPFDKDVPHEHRLLHAPPSSQTVRPAAEIVKLAKAEKVDAIVIGTHGRTGLSHLIAGSVAEEIMRDAPCPVVTVRKPKQ